MKGNRLLLFFVLLFVIFLPYKAFGDSLEQVKIFNINSNFDSDNRESISAELKSISDNAYFYIEQDWWDRQDKLIQDGVIDILSVLGDEFDNTIYPGLTSFYGKEWSPGIDGDYKITILLTNTKHHIAGYFRSHDEYDQLQSTSSNEREMIYLNVENIFSDIMRSYIAHELVHLLNFNQKYRLKGLKEEVWLNEARADFAPTYLGYDDIYPDSNLEKRVEIFLSNPRDSLSEWLNQRGDYGVVTMLMQYIADNYGESVIERTITSRKIGVLSIEDALIKSGYDKNFEDIFQDFVLTLFLNDCRFGREYCYKNRFLKEINVSPSLIYLPNSDLDNVTLRYSIKPWSANWYQIEGGEGDLRLKIEVDSLADFQVPYTLCNQNNNYCEIKNLELDYNNEGQIVVEDFDYEWDALTIMPFVKSKKEGFSGIEKSYTFSLTVLTEEEKNEEIEQLLKVIAELQKQIVFIKEQINRILGIRNIGNCDQLTKNLYFGIYSEEVKCLQRFLSLQSSNIYPEGIVSGFFGNLTKEAVIRFQNQYKKEILGPFNLMYGNGFVGSRTRSIINDLLK